MKYQFFLIDIIVIVFAHQKSIGTTHLKSLTKLIYRIRADHELLRALSFGKVRRPNWPTTSVYFLLGIYIGLA